MNDRKHTHTGHCQICGRIQAIGVESGRVAKHGYVVKGFGYFVGTCGGSDRASLQAERTLTDSTIVAVRDYAVREDAQAAKLKSGEALLTSIYVGEERVVGDDGKELWPTKWQAKYVPRAEADQFHIERFTTRTIGEHEYNARQGRSHADMLVELAARIHGTALIPVVDKPTANVGSKFTYGGAEWTAQRATYKRSGWRGVQQLNFICTTADGREGTFTAAHITKMLREAK